MNNEDTKVKDTEDVTNEQNEIKSDHNHQNKNNEILPKEKMSQNNQNHESSATCLGSIFNSDQRLTDKQCK